MAPDNDSADLDPLEQERLDAVLTSARRFNYASLALAVLVALFVTGAGSLLVLPFDVVDAGLVGLLLVIALAAGGDRLFRLAYPWAERDPRRTPFAWVGWSTSRGRWLTGTLFFLLPVVVAAGALVAVLPLGLPQLTLLVAAVLLAITPRVIEQQAAALPFGGSEEARRKVSWSSIWLAWLRILGGVAFGGVFSFILFAAPAAAPQPTRWAVGCAIAFLALLLLRGLVLLAHRPLDRIGARFGFGTEDSLHPTQKLVGKTVADVINTYTVDVDDLELLDKPRGKLTKLAFQARVDRRRVKITLELLYNAKKHFSVERKWDMNVILATEVTQIESEVLTGKQTNTKKAPIKTEPKSDEAEAPARKQTGKAPLPNLKLPPLEKKKPVSKPPS